MKESLQIAGGFALAMIITGTIAISLVYFWAWLAAML